MHSVLYPCVLWSVNIYTRVPVHMCGHVCGDQRLQRSPPQSPSILLFEIKSLTEPEAY